MLTTDEVNMAEEKINFVTAREEFWYQRKLRHPIMYEQQNVCALVTSNKLEGLRLPFLKILCAAFDLPVEEEDRRKENGFCRSHRIASPYNCSG